MSDYLIRGIGDGFRILAVNSTEIVNEAVRRHGSLPTASAAFGRALTMGVMMGAMLKNEDKVTITIQGGGPIGPIVIDSNAKGHVRGYIGNPNVHFDLNPQGKLDVRRAVGTEGNINVAKDIGLKENFIGSTEIISGELGEDFSYYFYSSEQVPSIVALGVLVNPDNTIKAAGGYVIQVMPDATEARIDELQELSKSFRPVSELIDEGLTPEAIMNTLLGEENWNKLSEMPVSFQCNCSKERFLDAISSLDPTEIMAMIQEDGGAEVDCHFCRSTIWIDKSELGKLLQR